MSMSPETCENSAALQAFRPERFLFTGDVVPKIAGYVHPKKVVALDP